MFWFEERIYPESWLEGDKWKVIWLLTRGGPIALLIIIFFILINSRLPLRSSLLATSIFSSAILTFVLIAVYRDLGVIQGEQSKIMDDQKSLLRLQYEPEVVITSWGVNGNIIEFILTNLGDGMAMNISLGVEIHPQDISYNEDFSCPSVPLYQDIEEARKSFLNGKETQRFVQEAIATTCIDSVQQWEFTSLVNDMVERGVGEIEIIIFIKYSDFFDEIERIDITSRSVNIHENMRFETALENSTITNTVSRHKPSDNLLEKSNRTTRTGHRTGVFFDPRFK